MIVNEQTDELPVFYYSNECPLPDPFVYRTRLHITLPCISRACFIICAGLFGEIRRMSMISKTDFGQFVSVVFYKCGSLVMNSISIC